MQRIGQLRQRLQAEEVVVAQSGQIAFGVPPQVEQAPLEFVVEQAGAEVEQGEARRFRGAFFLDFAGSILAPIGKARQDFFRRQKVERGCHQRGFGVRFQVVLQKLEVGLDQSHSQVVHKYLSKPIRAFFQVLRLLGAFAVSCLHLLYLRRDLSYLATLAGTVLLFALADQSR